MDILKLGRRWFIEEKEKIGSSNVIVSSKTTNVVKDGVVLMLDI